VKPVDDGHDERASEREEEDDDAQALRSRGEAKHHQDAADNDADEQDAAEHDLAPHLRLAAGPASVFRRLRVLVRLNPSGPAVEFLDGVGGLLGPAQQFGEIEVDETLVLRLRRLDAGLGEGKPIARAGIHGLGGVEADVCSEPAPPRGARA